MPEKDYSSLSLPQHFIATFKNSQLIYVDTVVEKTPNNLEAKALSSATE